MKNLTVSQKRNLTVFAFSVRMFLAGVEDAVILPSVWLYLQMFQVDYLYLGLVLSAYYVAGIGSSILVGHLADKTINLQLIGFIWILIELLGNIMYSLHYNMFLPLVGRIVAGFGSGYSPAIWAELARITTQEERTRYFTLVKLSYISGVVLGPVLNLFLKEFDFYIGNWHIDFRTSPGFFMVLMWILSIVIWFVFVYDLSDEIGKERGYELVSDSLSEEQFSKEEQFHEAYNMESPEDKHGDITSVTLKNEEIAKEDNGIFLNDSAKSSSIGSFRDALMDMFTKFHVAVVVYSIFFNNILHISLQAITPLVAEVMLHWSEDNVTFLFTFWGGEITIFAIFLVIFSPKIPDRLLILISAIFGTLSSVCIIPLALSSSTINRTYYSLLLTIVLDGIAVTVMNAVGRSSVSKHTNQDNQGKVQAIMTVLNRLSALTGPLLSSSLFKRQIILAIILSGSQIVGLILVFLAFEKLKINPNKS